MRSGHAVDMKVEELALLTVNSIDARWDSKMDPAVKWRLLEQITQAIHTTLGSASAFAFVFEPTSPKE